MIEMYDQVIIGSGAGGLTAFYELTRRTNQRLLLIEEGSFTADDVNYSDVSYATKYLYRDAGIRPAIGNPTLTIGEGMAVGGSTEINGGLFWRTPEKILNLWQSNGNSWANKELLNPIFEEFEFLLDVKSESTKHEYDESSRLLELGAHKLGWLCTEVPRVTGNNCIRSNLCPSGCPSKAKNTLGRKLLPASLNNGGEIMKGTRVEKLILRESFIEIAVSSKLHEIKRVKAQKVIVSCGAIESPRLLVRSGLISKNNVSVSFHANTKLIACFPHKVFPDKSTIFNRQIQEFLNEGILIMGANSRKQHLAIASSHISSNLYRNLIENFDNLAMYTTQTQVDGKITMPLFDFEGAFLRVKWSSTDSEKISSSLLRASRLAFAAGAEWVLLPFAKAKPIYSFENARRNLRSASFRNLQISTVHLMSSLPLSPGKASIIDERGFLFRDPRIRVLDASILPSSTIESPQATIMAVVAYMVRQSIYST